MYRSRIRVTEPWCQLHVQAQIEVKIHTLETNYLNETAAQSGGNIIHGFEGYLKNTAANRKKTEIRDEIDRTFSNSSVSYKKVHI